MRHTIISTATTLVAVTVAATMLVAGPAVATEHLATVETFEAVPELNPQVIEGIPLSPGLGEGPTTLEPTPPGPEVDPQVNPVFPGAGELVIPTPCWVTPQGCDGPDDPEVTPAFPGPGELVIPTPCWNTLQGCPDDDDGDEPTDDGTDPTDDGTEPIDDDGPEPTDGGNDGASGTSTGSAPSPASAPTPTTTAEPITVTAAAPVATIPVGEVAQDDDGVIAATTLLWGLTVATLGTAVAWLVLLARRRRAADQV